MVLLRGDLGSKEAYSAWGLASVISCLEHAFVFGANISVYEVKGPSSSLMVT